MQRDSRTKVLAENALKEALRDRRPTRGSDGRLVRDSRVRELAEAWLETLDGDAEMAHNTKVAYRRTVRKHVIPLLGALRLGECTVAPIDRTLTALKDSSGPSAAKTTRTVLSLMFGMAVRHEAITVNPVREVTRIRITRKRPKSLTVDQTEELLTGLRSMERAVELDVPDLAEWMLGTGCRIGEACAARQGLNSEGEQLLDWVTGTWEVDATIIRIYGAKRRAEFEAKETRSWQEEEELAAMRLHPPGLHIQARPKTAAGWRVLAVPQNLIDLGRRRQGELRLQAPSGILFGSPQAKALRDPSNTPGDLRQVLNAIGCSRCGGSAVLPAGNGRWKACTGVGPYGWVSSHTFRKTVATRMEEAGCTPREVADQLGHSKPSMTLDYYFGRGVVCARAALVLARPVAA